MALPESFMQDLKLKTDINDVISSYVTLKKRGNTYVGLCPFHNEKTPSFTVYPDTQSFYCFGCGAGGDAVGFVKKIENLDYIDAIKSLAQRAGLQMPEDGYDDSLGKKRRRILEMNRESAKFFHSYMMTNEGKVGLDYFLNRGLSLKTINHFGLGYAPNNWDSLIKHLKSKGFSVAEMNEAGLVSKTQKGNYIDFFRNRVMTPIIDVRGNVIAFGGRVLDDSKPKYKNSSETLVYKKTNELFALNFAKDSGEKSLILCEGYMDVIAMHQAGFTNAVAGCGTALTNEQVRLISRYADEVILTYDADEAGQKALNKAISLFNQTELAVRIPALTGGKDPDEIIRKYGRDKFKGMLEGASNEIEFALINLRKSNDVHTTQGKIDFINGSIKLLVNVSPVEQDLYLSRLAEELGVEKNSIKLQLDNYKRRKNRQNSKREFTKIVDDSIREARQVSINNSTTTRRLKAEERLIGLLMQYPDCKNERQLVNIDALSEGFVRRVFSLICQRLDDQLDIEISDIGQYLSDSEISHLSGIVARSSNSAQAKKEFVDCINVINQEYEREKLKNTDSLDDDSFRNAFKSNT